MPTFHTNSVLKYPQLIALTTPGIQLRNSTLLHKRLRFALISNTCVILQSECLRRRSKLPLLGRVRRFPRFPNRAHLPGRCNRFDHRNQVTGERIRGDYRRRNMADRLGTSQCQLHQSLGRTFCHSVQRTVFDREQGGHHCTAAESEDRRQQSECYSTRSHSSSNFV